MKKAQVQVGRSYYAKVSGREAVVELLREHPSGGWVGRNETTGREVRIKTAARLRAEAGPRALRDMLTF